MCVRTLERGLQVVQTRLDGDVAVHPSSINFNCSHFAHPFLLFHEKVLSSKVRVSPVVRTAVNGELRGDHTCVVEVGAVVSVTARRTWCVRAVPDYKPRVG